MIRMKNSSNHRPHLVFSIVCWLLYITIYIWLLPRSKPTLYHYTAPKSSNFEISSELTSIPDRLSYIWTSTRDNVLRKHSFSLNYRYGLQFEIKNNNQHLFLIILLSGDVATNPGPTSEKHLRCLSFNAQSIRSSFKLSDGTLTTNLQSFNDLVYAENLDVILMTETWLNDNFSNNEILPKGYHVIRKDRTANKRGGGVLIALRENIVFNRLNANKNFPDWSAHLELIAIEVDLANSKKCLVCVCYRPPNCNFKEWFHLFSSFLQETSKYDKVLIAGDFNFPDLTWNSNFVPTISERSTSAGSSEFRELCFDFFLHQINMYPTRQNNILDLVLTTVPDNILNLSCVSAETLEISSDHHLTFFDFQLFTKPRGCDRRTVFNFDRADWSGLRDALDKCDLSPSESTDVNTDWERWRDLFLEVAAEFIPRKTFKRRNSPPWVDGEVKRLLSKKDSCRKKAKSSSCPKLWEKFRNLRRRAKSLLKSKRTQYFQSLPSMLKWNSKKFWSVFKATSKTSNIPSKMTWTQHDSTFSTAENPVDIANLLNRYFYSVFNRDEANHEDSVPFPPEDHSTILETMSDFTLTEAEVCSVLRTINEDKATGPDKIPAVLLKNCATNISASLCDLFNKSLSSGLLPKEWKLSNICPIPKKSPHHEVSNYRPISLLSLVSKVFERCIYNRLTDHISSQLYKLQYGFQKGKSTTSQLLSVLHNIHKCLEKRCQVDTIYLDFAKAFDKVSHEHLLANSTTSVLGGIFFAGLEIIFLGDTNESLCWALHLNHFLCYPVSLRGQSLDHFSSSSM